MAHLQYMPGDPRLVDQLVCELKSKGIFDQFRKECIADVDTRPAYQNLRQRVETSVSTFLSHQSWKPDLNKNQLREKLRKHILDGNYLEQGVERIVDQVVNPKVASVFIPQVEDLVYNYLGIPRKKAAEPETAETKPEDLLPTDLEAVSPGSVKSNDEKNEETEIEGKDKMEIDKQEVEENKPEIEIKNDIEMSEVTIKSNESEGMDKCLIPLPSEEIKLENIPEPVNSPPKSTYSKVELDSIALPHEPNLSTDIPLPEEMSKSEKEVYFKPIQLNSEDSNSSSDSSLRRNMSPLTPIRNYNNENSCDAQQGFDTDSDAKSDVKTVPSSFKFTIENNDEKSIENLDTNPEAAEKKENDLSYQFNNQVNINTFNTPMYDDSSNSNNLHIDYESDVNSKTNIELKPEVENSQDSTIKDKKNDEKKSSHKSSHRSRDSSRHSSSKDKRSDSKHSMSRDSSRHDKKSSRDDKSKSSKERERSKDRSEKKDNRDSSKHRSSYKSSSKDKDSKSHKSSSSSHRHSNKSSEERKSSSSSSKDKDKNSDKSKDKPRDSKSSSSRESRDKDRKSSSNSKKPEDKDKKKDKKDTDDHYSSSGRGNHSRRSTDRDSNDGSSSSKGSQNHTSSKSSENKKDSKSSSSKSDNTSTSGESPSPSDKEHIVKDNLKLSQCKPIVRVDNHLETPIATPPRLPFVPDVTLKKPKFAANLQEAKKLMKMRKFLDDEQKRMNQEAALLLEFQANVRPSLSQVYSSIPGPELEFACVSTPSVQGSTPYEVNLPVKDTEESIEQKLANLENSTEENNTDIEMNPIPDAAQISEIIGVNIKYDENSVIEEVVLEDKKSPDNVPAEIINTDEQNSTLEPEDKVENTYDENKPFSELMDEISVYSKASETKTTTDVEETTIQEDHTPEIKDNIESNLTEYVNSTKTDNKYFEVTIITEELSESEEIDFKEQNIDGKIEEQTKDNTVIEDSVTLNNESDSKKDEFVENITPHKESSDKEFPPNSTGLQYFAEHDKYEAELARHEFSNFLKKYIDSINTNKKMFIINCDTYEENIVKEVASTMGEFEIINYYKNGHLKLPKTTNVIKDVALSNEVILPQSKEYEEKSPLFSPLKSECSFELCSSEYVSNLDDINKKSRQEVMEIILGSVLETSPTKIPDTMGDTDHYAETKEIQNVECEGNNETETIILHDTEVEKDGLKRSIDEVESSENNNRSVLTPKKMRKMSDSDQISSTTTEESQEGSNNNRVRGARSKYLGKARRVGLSRPKRTNASNSPSSDKSVENYVQNTPPTPNGKINSTPRTKVQRYDTSDLYKPKLHYLSRRHHAYWKLTHKL